MKKTILFIALLCTIIHSTQAQELSTPSPRGEGRGEGLSLAALIDSALVHNRTLQNAALEIEAAGHQRKEAYSKYFPEIKATVMAFHAFDKLIKGDGTIPQEIAALESAIPGISQYAGQPFSFSELNRGYGVTVSAMQPLYAGGQIHTGNQLAQVQEDVCRLQLQLKEKDIREKITENYWQICTIRYNLRTIAAAERQLDAVMQQVQNMVDAGVTTKNALLQVKLRKHELASNRLKLENADKTLLMLLAQQMGSPLPINSLTTPFGSPVSRGTETPGGGDIKNTFDIIVPDEANIPSPPLGEVGRGLGSRIELALAGKAVEAQKLQIKMERGKLLPTVAVGVMGMNMGMGGLSDQIKAMTKTNITNGVALGTISIPISAWWGGTHAIRRAKLKLREAENQYLDAQENLRIDTEASYNNLTEAYQQITIAQASVEESEENLRMHTDQYRVGTVTITDLLDAETLNRKSHDQLSSAIANYHIALTKYKLKAE